MRPPPKDTHAITRGLGRPYRGQPGGPQTGSPPSPPPSSICPSCSVSDAPRAFGSGSPFRFGGRAELSCHGVDLRDAAKLRQEFGPLLRQKSDNARIGEQACEIPARDHKKQMVGPVGQMSQLDLPVELS